MVKKHTPDLLSVIVPAYNCSTIAQDLRSILRYLYDLNRDFELICVVDGKKDGRDKTYKKAIKVKDPKLKIFTYRENRGKGYAIRFGMARSKGGTVAFIDAGGDLNASGIGMALEHMKWYNADIIVGSKRHGASKVVYPWQRKILSYIVQRLTRYFFGLNLTDTQTGLKIFKRRVLVKILPRLLVKRWAFDLEMLAVAHHLGFTRIFESPVEIVHNFSSNVGWKAVQNFAVDYLSILYRIFYLHYYEDTYRDRWEGDKALKLRYK